MSILRGDSASVGDAENANRATIGRQFVSAFEKSRGEEELKPRFHSGNRARIAIAGAALLQIFAFGFAAGARAQDAPSTSAPAHATKAATPKAAAQKAATPKAAAAAPAAKPASAPVKSYGSSGAPIKLEVFTDYQCPSCRTLFENTLRPLINDYVASGKVYILHHDYPLGGHQHSGEAARWANAAARVGQFGNVEGALYDNQMAWEQSGDIQKYVSAAMPAADFKRVQQQMQGCEGPGPTAGQNGSIAYPPGGHPCPLDSFIDSDIMIGQKIPVEATPTYRITYKGQTLPAASGAVSWPILKQFFDSLLAQ